MIYIGDKYKDKAGNVYVIKAVEKRDEYLYHSQMGGWGVLVDCVAGKHKGTEKWMEYNFFDKCIGDILEVVE